MFKEPNVISTVFEEGGGDGVWLMSATFYASGMNNDP